MSQVRSNLKSIWMNIFWVKYWILGTVRIQLIRSLSLSPTVLWFLWNYLFSIHFHTPQLFRVLVSKQWWAWKFNFIKIGTFWSCYNMFKCQGKFKTLFPTMFSIFVILSIYASKFREKTFFLCIQIIWRFEISTSEILHVISLMQCWSNIIWYVISIFFNSIAKLFSYFTSWWVY